MFTDQAFVASKPRAYYVGNGTRIDNLITIYCHLDNGKVDRKQFFQRVFKLLGLQILVYNCWDPILSLF